MSSTLEVFDELAPGPKARRSRKRIEAMPPEATLPPDHAGINLGDFYAHMPSHQYLFVPTRELWPATSVNGRLPAIPAGPKKKIRPSDWLDRNRPIEQMTWHPGEDMLITDRVMQVSGWAPHAGATVFNLYRPPVEIEGFANLAQPWIDHLYRVYPAEAWHIERWLAHRVQFPGDKVNHALVLGGTQGIGKDTILEPIKAGVGPWNWQDISPAQMLGRFNGWAKAVVLRISEARDLGDVDRFAFYDHSKTYIAAPPDVIRVDEKHLREHYVVNTMGVVITTNHKTDGLYLPADDRRHFVAWSEARREDFSADYWTRLYGWYASSDGLPNGGIGHVIAYLRQLDLSGFDPKAPPPKTAAFWAVVQAGESPESGELRDVIDQLGNPDALTLQHLIDSAESLRMLSLADELKDRRNRRALPHRLERVGYVPVRNPDADDGLFKVAGRRQAIYARRSLPVAEQVRAARKVS
ncbi:primase-helicase family protein [Hydrogenophaga sp. T2]|uniref:primase-helicase family protein n=1 Tax=Hydrogenophaga sp. T2 TaxID=3132823 RepID=UPI003CF62679